MTSVILVLVVCVAVGVASRYAYLYAKLKGELKQTKAYEYAQFKIDLFVMAGDKDKVESRVADIKLWLEKSGSPDLQFLLAYVYYHMGRFIGAKEAIDAAYEKLPGSPAVIALKKAINDAAGKTQPTIK